MNYAAFFAFLFFSFLAHSTPPEGLLTQEESSTPQRTTILLDPEDLQTATTLIASENSSLQKEIKALQQSYIDRLAQHIEQQKAQLSLLQQPEEVSNYQHALAKNKRLTAEKSQLTALVEANKKEIREQEALQQTSILKLLNSHAPASQEEKLAFQEQLLHQLMAYQNVVFRTQSLQANIELQHIRRQKAMLPKPSPSSLPLSPQTEEEKSDSGISDAHSETQQEDDTGEPQTKKPKRGKRKSVSSKRNTPTQQRKKAEAKLKNPPRKRKPRKTTPKKS